MNYDPTMLDIGHARQLLVDDLVIESVENVCRTWHQPARSSETPAIVKDRPWEQITYFTFNGSRVIRDLRDGLFKCIYQIWNPGVHAGSPPVFHLLYAESEDGVHWRKPALDVLKHGDLPTNVVIPDSYGMTYVLDPHEKEPSRRFKAIYLRYRPKKMFEASWEVMAATSEDLVHWSDLLERPQMGRAGSRMDDSNALSYDPAGRIFILNMRHYDMYAIARNLDNPVLEEWSICPPYYPLDWRRINKRRIWQTESADLIHWSEPYSPLTPVDGADGLDETYYGFCQFSAGSVQLGFLNTMSYVSNTIRTRLVYSRDGKNWRHLNNRQPFLSPSGEGKWDAYMVTISHGPLEIGDELYIYYGGSSNHHDWWISGAREGLKAPEAADNSRVKYALGLATMRRDGFVSLDAGPERRGILVTRPLISDGRHLTVNACCHTGGSIAAEIVNLRDEVFPGYSRQECDLFSGDTVQHTFTWRGKHELPAAPSEPAPYPKPEFERFRKIRFFMEKAELYAFAMT
jgi:hypothetical protein